MTKAIASRIAGWRLAGIVAILLVPILLLSQLTLSSMREKIRETESEIEGIRLATVLMPIAISIAEGVHSPEQTGLAMEQGNAHAAAIGLQDAYDKLKRAASGGSNSEAARLAQITNFVRLVGTESSLLLDEHKETFFLSLSNVEQLPELLIKFHGFHTSLEQAIVSNGVDGTEVKLLVYRLGTLGEAVDRARNAIARAKAASASPQSYEQALTLVNKIGQDVSVTFDVITSAAQGAEWLAFSMIAKQNIDAVGKYKTERAVWAETSERLENLLMERLGELNNKLRVLMGVAAACVLVAALAAIWMFRSTLKRLDTVEAEKRRADEALFEAETMAARVSAINDEVTTLNKDLAHNMQQLRLAQDELLLKGRMEHLGQLTATVAHEIRNPLGSVRTCAFLIGRKIAGKNTGIEAQLQRINNGVERCDKIITQLLDFSRTKEVDATPANLDEWLENVLREDVEKLPASVSIECDLGLGDVAVNFDLQRMRRAIENLINNSCEAMVGKGPESAEQGVANPRIAISTRTVGDEVWISVADNGPGMSAEILEKVREPMFTTKNFGTGLGVPAVEQIARQHGGSLYIESTPGAGATFIIRIPKASTKEKVAA